MTLKALYAQMTGDTAAHQRRIDGRFRKLPARQRKFIDARLRGKTWEAIASSNGAISRASAQSVVRLALERIRKELAGEPRFNRIGRNPAGRLALAESGNRKP